MELNFAARSQQSELMDTEAVDFEEFRACLVDLAQVNRFTFAYRPTLAFFDRLLASARRLGRPLEVVDVGSGYGDMLRQIDAWALRRGIAVSLTGVDLHPWSRRAAEESTSPKHNIRWITADAFQYRPSCAIDVVISSIFTHHLADPLVVEFLRWMEDKAQLGWFVSDLHRHPLPHHFFRHFAKLARFHPFVQHDGLVSIARAFTAADWRRLLTTAGIDLAAAKIQWTMPFRLTVERVKRR